MSFEAQVMLDLAGGSPFNLVPVPFDKSLSFLTFLYKMLQDHLVLSQNQLQNQQFSPTSPSSFQWRTVFRNQYLSAKCVLYYQCVTVPGTQLREIHVNAHTPSYLYLFLYLYIPKTLNYTNNFNPCLTLYKFHSSFPWLPSPTVRNLAPEYCYPQYIYLGAQSFASNQSLDHVGSTALLTHLSHIGPEPCQAILLAWA